MVKPKHDLLPWMNPHLLGLIDESNKLYTKSKEYRKKHGRSSLTIESLLRQADKVVSFWQLNYKNAYYGEMFHDTSDIKKTWRNINSILGRKGKCKAVDVDSILVDGVTYV